MNAPNWKICLSTTLFACLLAIGCSGARAQDFSKPLLLVASPALQGPYRQTTLVAVPIAGKHVGFILNRTTGMKLSTLFPDHAPSANVADPVYFGGPLMNDALFAVVRRNFGDESFQLFSDLFVTGNADAIDRIIEQTPNDARYFVGFVGWMRGELEIEIADGLWFVTEPDADLIFRHDTSGMWEELVTRLGNGHAPQRGRGLIESKLEAGVYVGTYTPSPLCRTSPLHKERTHP